MSRLPRGMEALSRMRPSGGSFTPDPIDQAIGKAQSIRITAREQAEENRAIGKKVDGCGRTFPMFESTITLEQWRERERHPASHIIEAELGHGPDDFDRAEAGVGYLTAGYGGDS